MEAVSDLMTFGLDELLGECIFETPGAFHDQIKDGEADGKSMEENVASLLEAVDAGGDKNEGDVGTTNVETAAENENDDSGKAAGETKTGENDGQESVECGFLVDRINTIPYQKALERGEVPFCAFAPISTADFYLLRIQNCSDTTRHMLVPASKDDVFNTPGALKRVEDEQEPGNDDSLNYRVAIVAIARQIYSEEDKQLVVSVDTPTKKDKRRIQSVTFLTVDKFADYAFLGFDGNVSEFAGNRSAYKMPRTGITSEENRALLPPNGNSLSTSAIPTGMKSPPKAPLRRGRGGRRRMSRQSPFRHPNLPFFPVNFQPLTSVVALPPNLPNDLSQLIKLEQTDETGQHYVTQGFPMPQVGDQSIYGMTVNMPALQVPAPVNEVTINTSDLRDDSGAQTTNHDLITIAFDQLLSSEVSSVDAQVSEKSSRGGRRAGPGRKPGRKPRNPAETDENGAPVHIPKRRGRPPKSRVPVPLPPPMPSLDNDHSNHSFEYCEDNYEKRMRMHYMD